jgi:CubicO group peptidase (beta-lactamase class C family)
MLSRRNLMLAALAVPGAGSVSTARAKLAPRFAAACALIEAAVERKDVDAAVLHVATSGETHERAFGHAVDPGAVFLLASITKPMTAAGVMVLVQSGQLALDAPVVAQVPALLTSATGDQDRKWRAQLTLRHLLTHTSGLPDMPPGNLDLRHHYARLPAFLAAALSVPLAFAPGSRVQYQSMGFLLAADIAERRAGLRWREFLRRRIFEPLEMTSTSLGLGDRRVGETMTCQVPADDGDWNSDYWRSLASPWGGALGTARDLARMLRFFARPVHGPLSPASVRAMLTPQTPPGAPGGADKDRYGLGFRLGGDTFARGLSPRTFGHGGSTGVVAWMDPDADLTCVLLTTRPTAENPLLAAVSAVVAAA